MSLSERLSEYVRACFTGIWIESHEHEDALAEVSQLCRQEDWRLATWDLERGLQLPGSNNESVVSDSVADPLAAVRAVRALANPNGTAVLVLCNFHRFLQSAEVVQALAHQIAAGKQNRTFLVILSPVVKVPLELEKQFVLVQHELPSRGQLEGIARSIATEDGELPEAHDLSRCLDAASGLTRYEAEGAFSLSLVRHGRIVPESIWELKSQTLKKSGLLSVHRGNETFEDLGGLASLKCFCSRALRQQAGHHKDRRPRGVLLLSPPGCGKSQFCKSLGNEVDRPTLILDIGSLMGSLVGQTEEQTRRAFRIIDAMQPAILMIDEVEKALSGVSTGGQTDSGVSARMFGTLLSWLNDHESNIFTICTANNVSKLPPEFSRAERFDGVFFLDLPSSEEKQIIWAKYLRLFELSPDQRMPVDTDWTGAEIRSCCRLAALLDIPIIQAAENVVPVARTSAEAIEQLRNWASGRCLAADRPGIYSRPASKSSGARKVTRYKPTDN